MKYLLTYLDVCLDNAGDMRDPVVRRSIRHERIEARNKREVLAKVEKFLAKSTSVPGEFNKPICLVHLTTIKWWKGNRIKS